MNPVAAISHFVALVVGVFGAFWVMGAVTPDLPDADVPPGVAVAEEEQVSLFNPAEFDAAIQELRSQEEAGASYRSLIVTSSQIETSPAPGEEGTFALEDVSIAEPMRLIQLVLSERPEVTEDQVRQLDLLGLPKGLVWVVELATDDPGLKGPLTYSIPAGTEDIRPGLPASLATVP